MGNSLNKDKKDKKDNTNDKKRKSINIYRAQSH